MTAVLSTNYNKDYYFFLPIVVWAWNELGINTIILNPAQDFSGDRSRYEPLVHDTIIQNNLLSRAYNIQYRFLVPDENKEVTYTQCARLFAAKAIDYYLSDEEIFVVSDIDMLVFENQFENIQQGEFGVLGYDLCPENQFPMCYLYGHKKTWDTYFNQGRSVDKCLHELLGHIEVDNMRGNYWSKDQETAYNVISKAPHKLFGRTQNGNPHAYNRSDRDDAFWMERAHEKQLDAHLWRPPYEENNVEKIVSLLKIKYPYYTFDWVIEYATKFRETINK